MQVKKLEAGDFVKIANIPDSNSRIDFDEEWIGMRALIMEICDDNNPDGPIGVVFAPWYDYLFCDPNTLDCIIRLREENLEIDKPWSLSNKEYFQYFIKHQMGSINALYRTKKEIPFLPGLSNCMIKGCEKKAIVQIYYNVYGTVNEAYVCGDHAHYHGTWTDGLLIKKDYHPFK